MTVVLSYMTVVFPLTKNDIPSAKTIFHVVSLSIISTLGKLEGEDKLPVEIQTDSKKEWSANIDE